MESTVTRLTNSFVVELFHKYKCGTISKDRFMDILAEQSDINVADVNQPAVISKMHRLIADDKKKKGKYRLELRSKPFIIPLLCEHQVTEGKERPVFLEIAEDLSKELGTEKRLHLETQERQKKILAREKEKNRKVAARLRERRLMVRKTREHLKQCRQKLARWDKQFSSKKSKHVPLPPSADLQIPKKTKADAIAMGLKGCKAEVRRVKKRNETLEKSIDTFKSKICSLEEDLTRLNRELGDFKVKNVELSTSLDYLQSLLEDTDEVPIYDEGKGRYTSNCIECIMNLDNYNVANHKIGLVIKEVLRLAGKHPNRIPSSSTIDNIVQSKGLLSQQHVQTVLPKEMHTTLYTHETRKFGTAYNVYLCSTEENSYMLGLREMYNKSAQTCLDTFQEILEDISECTAGKDGTEVGNQILANIKNTMSDRAQTEVAFNRLLEDYRKTVLPSVFENWNKMNSDEQAACGKMNNFFCGLHLLVSFAEVSAKALLKFEKAFYETRPIGAEEDEELKAVFCHGGDAACIRVIRAASKCFSRGGDEKSGCYGMFSDFCKQEKEKVKFVRFRGNRFNIVFLLAQVTYYHRDRIVHIFEKVHKPENLLQKAIFADIKVPLVTAGCKLLGLVSKLITAPLWRILEGGTAVLNLNNTYQQLLEYFSKISEDPAKFLTGEEQPFPDQVLKDDVFLHLITSSDVDNICLPMCEALFTSIHELLKRMVMDQLPGGKFWEPETSLCEETSTVTPHNKLQEFVFEQLDSLLRYRPHASTLTNESFLMYSMNRTGYWLRNLPSSEKEEMLNCVRSENKHYRDLFKKRCKIIQERREEKLKEKTKALEARRNREVSVKEGVTKQMIHYGLYTLNFKY